MVEHKVSLVICKCNVESDREQILHEELDKDKFQPDGKRVVFVKSNFTEIYHDSYVSTKVVKDKTTNKGRKPRPPKKRKNKHDKGTGEQFDSSVTFGIKFGNSVYNVIVFRKDSINISGLTSGDIENTKLIVNTLVDYINETDPAIGLRLLGEPIINLYNISAHINCNSRLAEHYSDNANSVTARRDSCVTARQDEHDEHLASDVILMYNLHRLKNLMLDNYNTVEFWDCENMVISYNNSNSYFLMYLLKDGQKNGVKLFVDGKVNIFGGKDKKYCEFILNNLYNILTDNSELLVQYSYPARLKSGIN